jgi:hypothetical protein
MKQNTGKTGNLTATPSETVDNDDFVTYLI